jgi:hypothetical protein
MVRALRIGRLLIDRPPASCYRRRALRRLRRLRTLVPSFVLAASVLSSFLGAGCGPVEYINQVGNKAASAVSAAKLAEADRYAPYEYTAAEEYLHKAREEGGYAQYQDAIDYGHKAEDLANRARAIAVARLAQQPTRSTRATPASEADEPSGAADDPDTAAAKRRARERTKRSEPE